MKKLSLILALIMMVSLFALAACGDADEKEESKDKNLELTAKEGEPANGFVWENNFSEITITGYVGASNDLVIPQKINGKPVTKIANRALSGFSALKSVKISSPCVDISGAFQNCTSLETVEINGVENIDRAFVGCTALETVKLPESVEQMDGAFQGCSSLKNVNIPASVTSINGTFAHCEALESIVIPKSVKEIGRCDDYSTFAYCSSLKTVVFEEGAACNVARGSFSGCTSLRFTKEKDFKYLGSESNPYYCLVERTSYFDGKNKIFEINKNTKVIADDIFHDGDYHCIVRIPASVIYIGSQYFGHSCTDPIFEKQDGWYKQVDNNEREVDVSDEFAIEYGYAAYGNIYQKQYMEIFTKNNNR